jgi:autotransporter-associated beta strand protein
MADSGFASGPSWFSAGPAWLINAMPGSNRGQTRYVLDRSGDLVEATPQYNGYVGTLRDVFEVSVFSSPFAGRGTSARGSQISSPAPDATLAIITWNVNAGGTWNTAGNWSPSGIPATGSDIVFSSATATGSAKATTLGTNFSIGSLTFNATQTGAVSIGGNQLTLNPSAINATTILVDTASGDHSISSTISIAGVNNQVFDIGAGRTFTISGNIGGSTGARGFTKSGAGTLVLSGASTYGSTTGVTVLSAGTIAIGSNGVVTGGARASGPVGVGGLTISDGTTFRSSNTTARSIQNNLSLSGNITLGDATNNGTLSFNSTDGTNTLTTAATVTLTANTKLTLNSAVVINNAIGGAGINLEKAGAGTLDLGASNGFSGTFTASGGTTNLNVNGALGSITALIVGTGATVQSGFTNRTDLINDGASVTLNGTSTLDLTGGTETVASLTSASGTSSLVIGKFGATTGSFTVGNSSSTSFAGGISGSRVTAGGIIFTKQGTGILTLGGTNIFSDVLAITQGGITITNNSALGANGANNGTTVSSGAVLGLDGTAGSLTIASELLTLNGAGLTSSPAGALRNIAGPNSWSGAITLGSGSTITSSAGTLTLTGGITNGGNLLTFDGSGDTTVSTTKITGAGGLSKTGAGTLLLSAANDYTGGTTVSSGLVLLNNSTALGSSSGSLTVNGGIVDLNGQNISVGNLTGSGGTIWNNGPNSGSSAVTLTIGNGNTGGGTYAGLIQDNNGASTGTVAVTKTGTGTITLSGTNTYTGVTTVTGGQLFINGNSSAATGAVNVNSGGTTLGGSGTTGGAVTVASGSNLSPGPTGVGSTAVFGTGALTLNGGSFFNVDLNGTTVGSGYDQVSVIGTVTLSLTSNLVVNVGGALALGNKFFITLNDGSDLVTGTFAQGGTVTANNGYVFLIDYLDNGDSGTVGNDISLTLTAVPEPSTWIGAALALGAIGFTQLRKRSRAGSSAS